MGLNPTNEKLASAGIQKPRCIGLGVLDHCPTSGEMGTEHEAAGPGGLPGPSATLKSMKGQN